MTTKSVGDYESDASGGERNMCGHIGIYCGNIALPSHASSLNNKNDNNNLIGGLDTSLGPDTVPPTPAQTTASVKT